jgi:hypothetical protein
MPRTRSAIVEEQAEIAEERAVVAQERRAGELNETAEMDPNAVNQPRTRTAGGVTRLDL